LLPHATGYLYDHLTLADRRLIYGINGKRLRTGKHRAGRSNYVQ
jgi:hypothetical protein